MRKSATRNHNPLKKIKGFGMSILSGITFALLVMGLFAPAVEQF